MVNSVLHVTVLRLHFYEASEPSVQLYKLLTQMTSKVFHKLDPIFCFLPKLHMTITTGSN